MIRPIQGLGRIDACGNSRSRREAAIVTDTDVTSQCYLQNVHFLCASSFFSKPFADPVEGSPGIAHPARSSLCRICRCFFSEFCKPETANAMAALSFTLRQRFPASITASRSETSLAAHFAICLQSSSRMIEFNFVVSLHFFLLVMYRSRKFTHTFFQRFFTLEILSFPSSS